MFPRRRVTVILLWVVTRVGGLGVLGGANDGVAYAAHIGGFIAGLALVKLFAAGRKVEAREW